MERIDASLFKTAKGASIINHVEAYSLAFIGYQRPLKKEVFNEKRP